MSSTGESSWSVHYDKGVPYYHNEVTNESKWTYPSSVPKSSETEMTGIVDPPNRPNVPKSDLTDNRMEFIKRNIGTIISMLSILMNIIVLSVVLGDVKTQVNEIQGGLNSMQGMLIGSISSIKSIGQLQGEILSQTSTVEIIKNTSGSVQRELFRMSDEMTSTLNTMVSVALKAIDLLNRLNETTRQINVYNHFISRVGEILPSNMRSISPTLDPLLTNGALIGFYQQKVQSITNLLQGCMCGYCGRIIQSDVTSALIINNNIMIFCRGSEVFLGNITSGFMMEPRLMGVDCVTSDSPPYIGSYFLLILNGVDAYNFLNDTTVDNLVLSDVKPKVVKLCKV